MTPYRLYVILNTVITRKLYNSLWPKIDLSLKQATVPVFNGNPIIDKLLGSYYRGEYHKVKLFNTIIERKSLPRVKEPATLKTKTSESLHTAQTCTTPADGLE